VYKPNFPSIGKVPNKMTIPRLHKSVPAVIFPLSVYKAFTQCVILDGDVFTVFLILFAGAFTMSLAVAMAVMSSQKHNKILLTFCTLNLLYCIDLHYPPWGDDGLEQS